MYITSNLSVCVFLQVSFNCPLFISQLYTCTCMHESLSIIVSIFCSTHVHVLPLVLLIISCYIQSMIHQFIHPYTHTHTCISYMIHVCTCTCTSSLFLYLFLFHIASFFSLLFVVLQYIMVHGVCTCTVYDILLLLVLVVVTV